MFVHDCLVDGERRRVVIDNHSISSASALDHDRTELSLRDGGVLVVLAPYRQVRDELLASRNRLFLVLD